MMSKPKIEINLKWLVLLTVLFWGEPDIIDSIIALIQSWAI